MRSELTVEEKHVLAERLRFDAGPPDPVHVVQGTDLLHTEKIAPIIETVQQRLNVKSKAAAASIFAKRYSYAIAVTGLYAMSALDKELDLSPGNVSLTPDPENPLWIPSLHLKRHTAEPRGNKYRDEWRKQVIQRLFKENINPVWDALSDAARISKYVLWENTAIYIYWLYEKELLPSGQYQHAKKDFNFLLDPDNGAVFGAYSNNPIARYYSRPQPAGTETIRFRKTCCSSYQLPKGKYCKTCPMTKECREKAVR
ncbi:siderophore-iron reductase FhuF [Bacillus marinisedimentorum]|uniref:siderophore-iron reductase FhuF n=1 Tax=Bacillus marinisedimentorum TaxID=1821260 RepID=UPI0007DFBF1E|nr:siderophore-iron reductase FhuF [Bacillus marinisedimentorum]